MVHAGHRLLHLDAVDAAGLLAWRSAIVFRPARRDLSDLPDRDAGQLFYLALPAGHYRRKHFILAQRHIHCRGLQLYFSGRPGRIDLLQHPASHADCGAEQQAIADVDPQQPILLSGRGISFQPAGAILAAP